jgi:phospholipase/lecithinase/hemolysin
MLGIRIADVDIYELHESILANPAAFGYTNVTTPAQGLAVNPDQYLYWDTLSHPTTTGHRLISQTADAAILATFTPEAATWAMMVSGVLLLAFAHHFRLINLGKPRGRDTA